MFIVSPPVTAPYQEWVDYRKSLQKISDYDMVRHELEKCTRWFEMYDNFISECD